MDVRQIQQKSIEIRDLYRETNFKNELREWDARAYTEGLMVDVAGLTKLLMIRDQFRDGESTQELIAHELADIIWSAFVIADELGIDLALELPEQLATLRYRFDLE